MLVRFNHRKRSQPLERRMRSARARTQHSANRPSLRMTVLPVMGRGQRSDIAIRPRCAAIPQAVRVCVLGRG